MIETLKERSESEKKAWIEGYRAGSTVVLNSLQEQVKEIREIETSVVEMITRTLIGKR